MQQNQYDNEMGKTTIGVLPDSSNEPIAGVGNGEVQNIQWESIIIDIGKLSCEGGWHNHAWREENPVTNCLMTCHTRNGEQSMQC